MHWWAHDKCTLLLLLFARSYNYSDIHYPGQQQPPSSPEGGDPHYQHDPHLPPPLPPQHTAADSPYEYISARNLINSRPQRSGRGDNPPELPPPPRDDYDYDPSQTSRAFSNSVYMDHRDVDRARSGPGDPEAESMRLDQAGYTRPRWASDAWPFWGTMWGEGWWIL